MTSIENHKRQPKTRKVWLFVLGCVLFLGTLSIIHTPFAVPGQQTGILINQGQTLARVSPRDGSWQSLSNVPFKATIHQVVTITNGSKATVVACDAGLYSLDLITGSWTQLLSQEVFTVASLGEDILVGTRAGLLRKSRGRSSWKPAGNDLPGGSVPIIVSVAPSDQAILYVGTARHGVFRSDDAGDRFSPVNEGLPSSLGVDPVTPVRNIVVDPLNPYVAYASTEVNGIYRTSDGGATWVAVSEGMPGLFPYRTYQPLLAHHPAQSGTVYAVVGFPVHSHLIDNVLYKTTDGGARWVAIARLPENTVFYHLSMKGGDPTRLLMGHAGGVVLISDDGQRVDADKYWKPSPTPLRPGSSINTDAGEIAILEDDGTLNQNFDLHERTIEFTPTGQGGYTIAASAPQLEPEFGDAVEIGKDGSVSLPLPFSFPFYEKGTTRVFVNANGNLTFERADSSGSPSPSGSFIQFRAGQPRIAVLWEDFDPTVQGSVRIRTAGEPARVVVTWDNVRVDGLNPLIQDSNTFQVVLFEDGLIRMNYGALVTSHGGLVGLSPGNSLASPFILNLSRDLPQTADSRAVLDYYTGRGLDIQATARKFYETHSDLYDQLVVFMSTRFRTNMTGVAGALAYHRPVQNEVLGIGLPVGDISGGPSAYGSQGRLQSFLNMNLVGFYPNDPNQEIAATITSLDAIAHETAHRWLAYLLYDNDGAPGLNLLQLDFTHWNFFLNTDASLMYGNDWRDNDDGTFTSVDATSRYGILDEYAMGLRPPPDVNPVFFINQPTDTGGRTRNNLPEIDAVVGGTRGEVRLDQIVAVNGPRSPSFGYSPTSLRQAFVFVVPEGQPVIPEEVEKVDRFRREFEPYFNQLTSRKAVVDTRLAPGQPDLVIDTAEINPPVVFPGQSATLSFTIRNQGTSAAGLVLSEIRYSEDDVIDPVDPVVKALSTTSLMPGATDTLTGIPVVIPGTASAGAHYITLALDTGNAAFESDESNNGLAVPVTVLGAGAPITAVTEIESNDRLNQAMPISPDTIITATLNPSRDVDYYWFNGRAGQAVTVDINARSLSPASTADTLTALLDGSGDVLVENDDYAGSPDSFVALVLPHSGRYYIRIRSATRSQGGPDARYQAVVILRNTGTVGEIEPNDTLDTATEVMPDVIVSGRLDAPGDQDIFFLTAGVGQILTLDVDAQSLVDSSQADTVVTVLDAAGSVLAENDDFGGSKDSYLTLVLPRAGRVYVRLRDVAGRGGPNFPYRISIRLASARPKK